MNRYLFNGALVLGAAAVAWVASGFLGTHPLALAMTVVIAAVYGFGALELHQYRRATQTLSSALANIPAPLNQLGDWLQQVHPSLRNPVRLRIEGERTGLPGPALTPYLVGLLVMFGMLGTFLGMVVTLNGAVFALEGTTDLQAMRSVFAAPIKGLGLAFGTSVAGVATSAMLGLMSALSRRERLQAAQTLDTQINLALRPFSLNHQRQESLKALQAQSEALPAVVNQLHAMMAQMERLDQQRHEQLQTSQKDFQNHVTGVFTTLATSVDQSLRESLRQSSVAAVQSIQPVVETAMQSIVQASTQLQSQMAQSTQSQLETLSAGLLSAAASAQTQQDLSNRERMQTWIASLQSIAEASQTTARATLSELGQLMQAVQTAMQAQQAGEARWADQHTARMDDVQTALTEHLATLGTALEKPITQLLETAAEAPRAAAQVIDQLRQEMSSHVARDNELLQERTHILETLNGLLASIRHASVEQREVIDSLVVSSANALERAGADFSDKLGTEAEKLSDIAAHVGSSAVEVSSLSEALGLAVRSFGEANEKLITNLQRIEQAMDKSMLRSDEQLAYYVAQAREIIDLSMTSQKDIFEALQQLPKNQVPATEEVA